MNQRMNRKGQMIYLIRSQSYVDREEILFCGTKMMCWIPRVFLRRRLEENYTSTHVIYEPLPSRSMIHLALPTLMENRNSSTLVIGTQEGGWEEVEDRITLIRV